VFSRQKDILVKNTKKTARPSLQVETDDVNNRTEALPP